MRTKIKIVVFLICVFTTILVCSLSGCGLSATPTKKKVCDIVLRKYNITLPESIKLTNYATDVGFDGGVWFCVFSYNFDDQEFNSLLSDERNDEFENKFFSKQKSVENYFNKEYTCHDLKEDYKWFYAYETPSDSIREYELLILCFEKENQLIVIDDTIQVRNKN